MRIISQNRNIDVPYERIALFEYQCRICASFGYHDDGDFFIGEYKTKERCIDIMSEIRQNANSGEPYYYMPKE